MNSNADIQIRLTSNERYVCVVRSAAQTLAGQLGLDETNCAHVALAVAEALANVIEHGYKGRGDQPIAVTMHPGKHQGRDALEIVIEDEATDVDLAKIKSRPLDEIRPGGLGVHIISQIMDDVSYANREDRPGVRLRMIKLLPPASAANAG